MDNFKVVMTTLRVIFHLQLSTVSRVTAVCANIDDYLSFVKSVHHRTIQINHQPDPTIFQFIILTFNYSSTCFGEFCRPLSGAQWLQWQPLVLPSYRGDSRAVFVVGPVINVPTTNKARLSQRYDGKTGGRHCSHLAPDDGRKNAWNMLRCK